MYPLAFAAAEGVHTGGQVAGAGPGGGPRVPGAPGRTRGGVAAQPLPT